MVNFWPQIWYLGINLKDILVGVFLLDSVNQQAVREAARYAPAPIRRTLLQSYYAWGV